MTESCNVGVRDEGLGIGDLLVIESHADFKGVGRP